MSDEPCVSPEQSPKSLGRTPEPDWSLNPASPEKRFLNMVIDGAVLAILASGMDWLLAYVYAATQSQSLADASPSERWLFETFCWLLSLLVVFGYYVILESLFQRTIGKLLTGTQVVNAEGGRASFRQVLGRTLVRFFLYEVFTFLWRFSVGMHDSWSGTRVVNRYDLELIPPEDRVRARVRDPRPPGLQRAPVAPR